MTRTMIRTISNDVWQRYKELLPKTRTLYQPMLPVNLPYQGSIRGDFDYVLPDEVLGLLRTWLSKRGEEFVYYFLTESTGDEPTDFEVATVQLTHDDLAKINQSFENAIVAKDFTWALFVDHEGTVHVSGPPELMSVVSSQVQGEL